MNKCSLCNRDTEDSIRAFSSFQIKSAVGLGMALPDLINSSSVVPELPPEELRIRRLQELMSSTSDWFVCSTCAAQIELHLGAVTVATPGAELIPEPLQPTTPTVESLKTNPDFPTKVSPIARLPESKLKIRAASIGTAMGLVLSLLIALIAKRESMLGHMFSLRSVSTLIPVAISCMFCWAIVVCFFRWRRLQELERISSKGLLLHATRLLSTSGVDQLTEDLERPECMISPLLRRLQALLKQWKLKPSLQDADLVMQQHVANDEEAVRAGYNLVRTFIWALPVLGLIGTVIGISLAVGGFAQFLGTEIEDVALIKRSLVGVTGGLSYAFLITLQGLLTALLTMLAASALQLREEKLYSTVGQDIAEVFLPILQKEAPEPVVVTSGATLLQEQSEEQLEFWRSKLEFVTTEVLGSIAKGCYQMIANIDRREELNRAQSYSWAEEMRHETEDAAARLGLAIGRMGDEMAKTSDEFVNRLSVARGALDHQVMTWREMLESQARVALQQHEEALGATREQSQTLKLSIASLSSLSATTSDEIVNRLSLARGALDHQVTTWREMLESQARVALQQHEEALGATREQSQTLKLSMASLSSLSETTRDALNQQAELQSAINRFNDSSFHKNLTELASAVAVQMQTVEAVRLVLGHVASGTSELLASQTTLQSAMSQLHDAGLEHTLATFRDSLASLGPVLSSFREPFVLQAIPVAKRAEAGA